MIISLYDNITVCDRSSIPENYDKFDKTYEFKTNDIFIYWITEVSRFLSIIENAKEDTNTTNTTNTKDNILLIINDDDDLYTFIAVYNIVNNKQRKDITVRNLNGIYGENIHLSVKHKKFIDKLQSLIVYGHDSQQAENNYNNNCNHTPKSIEKSNSKLGLVSCIPSTHSRNVKTVTFW